MNESMNKITLGRVMNLVKKLIANITNRNVGEIILRLELRSDPLRFNDDGVRALAVRLNDIFIAQDLSLTPDMVQSQKTIGDLVELVWNKIANSKKIDEDI